MRSTDSVNVPCLAAAGSAASQVRHQPSAFPGTQDQDIHLPPGQAKRLSSGVGGVMPDHLKRCQCPDDFRPVSGLRPSLVGQGGNASLGNR